MLDRSFYDRSTLEVARDLIGLHLVRRDGDGPCVGRIVETEAYIGPHDLACHAAKGKTKRTAVMFGPPGHAYVYLIYGMYWCLNLVTEPVGHPSAILIRAVEPVAGLDRIRARRPKARSDAQLTAGPGRLCMALDITGDLNGADLCTPDGPLTVEDRNTPARTIVTAPRVGVDYAGPWALEPFRFFEDESPYISTPPR